jgi:calcineurin-like phosphoesterase family protein
MSRIFYTSDLHIGHRKVAGIRFDRFHTYPHVEDEEAVTWHDAELAKRWNRMVAPEDTVIVVGDISVGGNAAQTNALAWIAARPGDKRLVTGNHDGVSPSHRDFHKWVSVYSEVFSSVSPFMRRRIDGENVMVSHFPYDGDHTPEDRDVQYRLRDMGLPVIHGHTHSPHVYSVSRAGTPQVNVSVDAWAMAPVSQESVAKAIFWEERSA